MIKNKWLFSASIILFLIFMVLRTPFPNMSPLGTNSYGVLSFHLNYGSELFYLFVFIIIMFIYVRSLSKRKFILSIVTIFMVAWIPEIIVKGYQYTFASGVDAVSFDSEEAECRYNSIQAGEHEITCHLVLSNHSSNDVDLMLNIYEPYIGDPEHPLFAREGEEPITLVSRSTHGIELSRMVFDREHVFGKGEGSFSIQNIQIREKDKVRDL
ncbi:hypothetical protein [Alkalicoccobacillus murimartini]|uniref:DUF4352 domain-containing protein n=1 Tax=Alkalicoccobacillus murimartini TaxID=171685 RepID=A0ABT9YE51_9BACI|nr:hypothetical protein [Alkalicoccobacillus murimartini]MDQ0206125.1 hypothetical protein [Alkalicoccobacillus murimartini]